MFPFTDEARRALGAFLSSPPSPPPLVVVATLRKSTRMIRLIQASRSGELVFLKVDKGANSDYVSGFYWLHIEQNGEEEAPPRRSIHELRPGSMMHLCHTHTSIGYGIFPPLGSVEKRLANSGEVEEMFKAYEALRTTDASSV